MYPLLLALTLLLPFELTEPLFFVGPIGITSVELPLYMLVAFSLTRREVWSPGTMGPVHWAALAWAAVHLTSAAAAAEHRDLALRFALRASAGALLVFPVSAVAHVPGQAMKAFQALAAGAAASAALAVAEAFLPGGGALLSGFKTVSAQVGDTLRASGPFQYPNPAALYWGATVPVVLVVGLAASSRTGRALRWAAAACVLLLATAIAATGSRGGLLATAAVLGLLAATATLPLRRAATWAIVVLAMAVAAVTVTHPGLIVRDSGPGEPPWFAGRFELVRASEIGAGQGARLTLRARNVGALAWDTVGPMPIGVAAQWIDGTGKVAHEEPVTPLSRPLPKGGTDLVDLLVTAPGSPGEYRLRFQIVGGNTSFETPAGMTDEASVTVLGPPAPEQAWPAPRMPQKQAIRVELWRAGFRMWRAHPILGVGPDNFRRLYGAYLGPRRLDDRVNANSLYVETAADLGLVGAASLLLLFVALARAALRAARGAPEPDRSLVVASSAALLAFALHGLVDSVLAVTPLFGLFWIHAGVLAGLASPRR